MYSYSNNFKLFFCMPTMQVPGGQTEPDCRSPVFDCGIADSDTRDTCHDEIIGCINGLITRYHSCSILRIKIPF